MTTRARQKWLESQRTCNSRPSSHMEWESTSLKHMHLGSNTLELEDLVNRYYQV